MVVKSVSLVELKKQQWAKEKGEIFHYIYGQNINDFGFFFYYYFIRPCFRRTRKTKRILEKSKDTVDRFQRSKVNYLWTQIIYHDTVR